MGCGEFSQNVSGGTNNSRVWVTGSRLIGQPNSDVKALE